MTLVALVRDGDREAFGEFARRQRPRLLAQAGAVVGAPGAEDVVQTALANAYGAACRGSTPRNPCAWLATITHHEAVSELRRRRQPPTASLSFERSVSDVAAEREQVRRVVEGLKTLPESERAALIAQAFEDKDHEQIAAERGTSAGAVRMATHRGRRRLRPLLGGALWIALVEPVGRSLSKLRDSAGLAASATGGAAVTAGVIAVAVSGGLGSDPRSLEDHRVDRARLEPTAEPGHANPASQPDRQQAARAPQGTRSASMGVSAPAAVPTNDPFEPVTPAAGPTASPQTSATPPSGASAEEPVQASPPAASENPPQAPPAPSAPPATVEQSCAGMVSCLLEDAEQTVDDSSP